MVYRVFLLLVFLAIAIGGGAASVWFALDNAPLTGRFTSGPWQAFPLLGTPQADPYSRARYARSGGLPLGPSEGIVLTAREDSNGDPLRRTCTYVISGQLPPARLWTLHLTDADGGFLPDHGRKRAALHSWMVVYGEGNSLTVHVSRQPQPGNWLPSEGNGRMQVVLTLFDTSVAVTSDQFSDLRLPTITRADCYA